MSANGTNRTSSNVRCLVANGGKAEVARIGETTRLSRCGQ